MYHSLEIQYSAYQQFFLSVKIKKKLSHTAIDALKQTALTQDSRPNLKQ